MIRLACKTFTNNISKNKKLDFGSIGCLEILE